MYGPEPNGVRPLTGPQLIQSNPCKLHYSDVIMAVMASQITSLTIFYSTFFQAQIKEYIKAPRHWPLCGEFTGDRWILRTNGQLRGKCFQLMTSYHVYEISLVIWVLNKTCWPGDIIQYGRRDLAKYNSSSYIEYNVTVFFHLRKQNIYANTTATQT